MSKKSAEETIEKIKDIFSNSENAQEVVDKFQVVLNEILHGNPEEDFPVTEIVPESLTVVQNEVEPVKTQENQLVETKTASVDGGNDNVVTINPKVISRIGKPTKNVQDKESDSVIAKSIQIDDNYYISQEWMDKFDNISEIVLSELKISKNIKRLKRKNKYNQWLNKLNINKRFKTFKEMDIVSQAIKEMILRINKLDYGYLNASKDLTKDGCTEGIMRQLPRLDWGKFIKMATD